jgi:cell division inhibitor SepF
MAKFMDKMMDMMKLNDYEDEEEIDIHLEETPAETENAKSSKTFKSFAGGRQHGNHSANVVNFQTSVKMEVVVIQPESYDEAQDICDHIKSQRPVIINLEKLVRTIAQRFMDFVSG